MKITPNIKNMSVYTLFYGLFTSALLVSTLVDYSHDVLLLIMIVTIVVNTLRFMLISRKKINFVGDQLYVDGLIVLVSHKNKAMASLCLDAIEYESSPWKKSHMGRLYRYMFSKEQWALITNISTQETQAS